MRVARVFFLYPVFHQAPRTSQQQCEDKCSAYFFLLHPSELTEEERWELEDIGWLSPGQEKIRLLRDKHEAYLRAPLSPFPLPAGYAKLDASRSWLLYWIRSNSIHILTPQHHFFLPRPLSSLIWCTDTPWGYLVLNVTQRQIAGKGRNKVSLERDSLHCTKLQPSHEPQSFNAATW